MPRPHTEQERQEIHKRLLSAGHDRFIRVGLQKTTLSDLASDAGIGKGSFYQFFPSKEDLFMAVQEDEEAQFKRALVRDLGQATNGREAVVGLLRCVATRLERHPFLRVLLDPHLLGALTLRISPARLREHQEQDRGFFLDLARGWKEQGWLRSDVEPQIVFDVLVAMFGISVQRELLGSEVVQRATAELAEAIADRWCD
ncbi:MAG: TetR/AcrR family transcriptional regulator [Nannocystaceae bacterium]|nr:TetR/AcrR family transcriptional regulator [Nannocystaceae bacterium]